jgi:hypothetical protein
VVDFQWNPASPWTFFSVADEAGLGGGGTLQLWRVSDMVYRPEEEVLVELEQYRWGGGGGMAARGRARSRRLAACQLKQCTAAALQWLPLAC